MIQSKHRMLATLVAMVLLLGFSAIAARLVDLQLLQNAGLREISEKERAKVHVLQGRRGRILDARGDSLAMSIAKKTIVADARLLSSLDLPAQVAPVIVQKTAQLLGLDERQVWGRLSRDSCYVVLQHKVAKEQYEKLTNAIYNADFGLDANKLPRRQRVKFLEARRPPRRL